MLSLWPSRQFIFQIRVLQYKTVEFARTSLSYRPIAALSTGVDRHPRLVRVFAQIRGEIFAFLGLRPSVIARFRVQISDLAPLYRTVGATLSTGCYVAPRRLNVRRDGLASNTGRRGHSGPLSISLLSPSPYWTGRIAFKFNVWQSGVLLCQS